MLPPGGPPPVAKPAAVALSPLRLKRRLLPALLSASVILPLGLALNYALNVVLARQLPVADYGLFAYVQSLAGILALVASLGFSTSMMRLVAAYRARGETAALRGLIRASLRLISVAGAVLVILLLAMGWAFPGQRNGMLWAALLLLPLTWDVWRESAMRGLHRTSAAILPRQVLLPGLTLAVVLGLGLRDANEVLIGFVLVLLLVELSGFLQLRSALGFPKQLLPVTRTREWLHISLPMAGSNLARYGMTRWDVVVVGLFVGLEASGPYAAAARTAVLASLVLRVVNLVIGPVLAELYHAGDPRRFRTLVAAAAAGAAAVGLPLYLLVMLRPEWVLGLFGPAYSEAALPLQILATGQFINLITGPVGLALTMSSHEMTNLRLVSIASVISLVGLLLVVPLYGVVGAAIVTTSTITALSFATAWLTGRYFWQRRSED